MTTSEHYRDPALRALLKRAAAGISAAKHKRDLSIEAKRRATAAPLRNPEGPVTRRAATLADVLGTRR